MKKELIAAIQQCYTQPTAIDAVTFLCQRGLISPKAVRDFQIKEMFDRLHAANPKRAKLDIMYEITACEELGLPSFGTVKAAVYIS